MQLTPIIDPAVCGWAPDFRAFHLLASTPGVTTTADADAGRLLADACRFAERRAISR